MVFPFLRDRRQDAQLKLELEYELQQLGKPPKKGKTVDAYFREMVAFVQRFCDRKIAFLPKFERNHGVVFSPGYRRRYLAKCFDSLAEDLQKILLEYLEIDFIFFVQGAAESHRNSKETQPLDAFWRELEEGLLRKTRRLLNQWYDEPLRAYLEVIVKEGGDGRQAPEGTAPPPRKERPGAAGKKRAHHPPVLPSQGSGDGPGAVRPDPGGPPREAAGVLPAASGTGLCDSGIRNP